LRTLRRRRRRIIGTYDNFSFLFTDFTLLGKVRKSARRPTGKAIIAVVVIVAWLPRHYFSFNLNKEKQH
jgi:hypothetical protein